MLRHSSTKVTLPYPAPMTNPLLLLQQQHNAFWRRRPSATVLGHSARWMEAATTYSAPYGLQPITRKLEWARRHTRMAYRHLATFPSPPSHPALLHCHQLVKSVRRCPGTRMPKAQTPLSCWSSSHSSSLTISPTLWWKKFLIQIIQVRLIF
ncbi:hypothetical protein RvY_18900-2 [Ramazzottius varieornatus]|uniref:Uncharacterized protein n=1 Tax=Ramazzottius varieornatus TaxID=947166 RepID=A0A1D1WBA6_RAMVA|nr:hypothetical protein RvY_18900-2 [Ramazzottius varieornatus]